jgi:hypothetical protein
LPDFVYWVALPLHAARAGRYDQELTQRVGVPRRPGAALKNNSGSGHSRWRVGSERRVDPHAADEVVGRRQAGRL